MEEVADLGRRRGVVDNSAVNGQPSVCDQDLNVRRQSVLRPAADRDAPFGMPFVEELFDHHLDRPGNQGAISPPVSGFVTKRSDR